MVLAGTALTALVAFYIFPYNWSFNLAMTIGSILSATDPVAVSALLDEVSSRGWCVFYSRFFLFLALLTTLSESLSYML